MVPGGFSGDGDKGHENKKRCVHGNHHPRENYFLHTQRSDRRNTETPTCSDLSDAENKYVALGGRNLRFRINLKTSDR